MFSKATFLHHNHEHYSNFKCCNKKCNHSLFVVKLSAILPASVFKLASKNDFKRNRYPVHIIISVLLMLFQISLLIQNSICRLYPDIRDANSEFTNILDISNTDSKFSCYKYTTARYY